MIDYGVGGKGWVVCCGCEKCWWDWWKGWEIMQWAWERKKGKKEWEKEVKKKKKKEEKEKQVKELSKAEKSFEIEYEFVEALSLLFIWAIVVEYWYMYGWDELELGILYVMLRFRSLV
jgi:hypothetical protein